jgi:allene oxide cyclase
MGITMTTKLFLGLAVTATAAAGIGITAAQASPSSSDTKFTVVEHAITDTTIDNGTPGDSIGDLLAFGNPVYNAANTVQVGSDQGCCVRTTPGVSYECSWTLNMKAGPLVVQGPFNDKSDSILAITGGTGAYASARGQMRLHARNAAGSSYDFTYRIRA